MDYEQRVEAEIGHYAEVEDVHDLPPIHHYYAARYLSPKLEQVGIASLGAFFADPVVAACASADRTVRVASIGSGNGDLEVQIVRAVADAGHHNLRFECIELNESMIARTVAAAEVAGVAELIVPVLADLNRWTPASPLDVVMANHSLHHILELERLFDAIAASMSPDSVLLVNDMIGRNGHQRWPEALDFVQRIWDIMPEEFREDHQLGGRERWYANWNCAVEGFEGIRAQDILPLLLERFYPERFVTFMNLIDIFVDRSFGPNFDIDNPTHCAFIDNVAKLDEAALDLGLIRPTHLIGSFRTVPAKVDYPQPRSPAASVRAPSGTDLCSWFHKPVAMSSELRPDSERPPA